MSEVKQAVAKAEDNATRARSAKNAHDREFYERMSQKWLGVAASGGAWTPRPVHDLLAAGANASPLARYSCEGVRLARAGRKHID